MTNDAKISIKGSDSEVIILAGGVLDLFNSQALKDGLSTASKTAENVVVDFKSAQFIDSAIVQYLADAGVKMINRGKRLKVVVAEGSYPQQVIRTVGFDQLMDVQAESAPSAQE